MKAILINSAVENNQSNKKEEGKMKKMINIIAILMVMVLVAISGVAVAGHMPERNQGASEVSTGSQFSTLNGISAELMNEREMSEIEGKVILVSVTYQSLNFSMYRPYSVYRISPALNPEND